MKQSMKAQTTSTSSNNFRGTLLVIDDTPENLTVLRKCLTDHHYRVAVARNGKVALERVKRIRPDLILLDVLMPGMDGFEVCRQLKADEMTRAIPVIFMTALDTCEDKEKGFEAGAEDYVTKPLNNKEVLARIHTHVTLYKLQQESQTRNAELHASLEGELNGILGYCRILLKKLPESNEMTEYVTGIYQSGLRLHRLILSQRSCGRKTYSQGQ
jgi:CheY-like chemotaxis protein